MPDTTKMPRTAAGRAGLFGAEDNPAEKAASQVRSAMDSINLINALIADGGRSERELNTISRNVEHLKIVVGRDVVKSSTEDLAPLNEAITAGTAFLAADS